MIKFVSRKCLAKKSRSNCQIVKLKLPENGELNARLIIIFRCQKRIEKQKQNTMTVLDFCSQKLYKNIFMTVFKLKKV